MRTGFHGTSFRQIAEATGLSQAGLAHHFPTKDDLLLAVLEQRDLDHVAASTDDHGLALLDGLRRILAEVHETPAITQLFTSLTAEATDPDYPGREFFVRRYERVRGTFAAELAAGGVDAVRPEVAAVLLAAVMDGLQIQWLLDDSLDIESAFGDFIALLTGSLRAEDPGPPPTRRSRAGRRAPKPGT